ncbi:uncharacterized protein LOC127713975 [Mytilus californianus]|uniref:uncharacterized protein LOC127713975 n=1 Tax=Mytilus californianus TaxID=6549 RepID=UPI002247B32D|nr:uncharacterized protein LOC127713975 [Mytilus californianus]
MQQEDLKAVIRKANLDTFLQNASECCSLSEQLINRNSMRSFLNVYQTIDVHVKRYLHTTVKDSTGDEMKIEKKIKSENNLELINRNVKNLEISEADEVMQTLIDKDQGSGVLIESKTIFKSESNSRYVEGRFILKYRPSEHTIFLLAKSPKSKTTIEFHRVQSIKFKGPLWPVFAAYDFNEIAVSINIKTNEVGFDRYTLHQNLYIYNDNKTMSNKNLSGTYQNNNFTTPIILMRPMQIGNSNDFQIMLDIDFDDSNWGHVFFKIGLRWGKDASFKATLLLECWLCNMGYVLGLYRTMVCRLVMVPCLFQ